MILLKLTEDFSIDASKVAGYSINEDNTITFYDKYDINEYYIFKDSNKDIESRIENFFNDYWHKED